MRTKASCSFKIVVKSVYVIVQEKQKSNSIKQWSSSTSH